MRGFLFFFLFLASFVAIYYYIGVDKTPHSVSLQAESVYSINGKETSFYSYKYKDTYYYAYGDELSKSVEVGTYSADEPLSGVLRDSRKYQAIYDIAAGLSYNAVAKENDNDAFKVLFVGVNDAFYVNRLAKLLHNKLINYEIVIWESDSNLIKALKDTGALILSSNVKLINAIDELPVNEKFNLIIAEDYKNKQLANSQKELSFFEGAVGNHLYNNGIFVQIIVPVAVNFKNFIGVISEVFSSSKYFRFQGRVVGLYAHKESLLVGDDWLQGDERFLVLPNASAYQDEQGNSFSYADIYSKGYNI